MRFRGVAELDLGLVQMQPHKQTMAAISWLKRIDALEHCSCDLFTNRI